MATKKKTTRRKTTARRKSMPARGTKRTNGRRPSPAARSGLSLDRKLDIVGVGLALAGLLTLLSLLSSNRGSLTGSWVAFLSEAFGWGVYAFPLVLMAVGLWLVLRNFERIPQFNFERIGGLLMLFVNLLVLLHLTLFPATSDEAYALAGGGLGGGY